MDGFSRFWGDVGTLHTLSAWLQWLSIGLVFISGFLQVGKYIVDRREGALSALAEAERLNPHNQPVRTGTATVEVTIESNEQINAHYMDQGGYLAFVRGTETLMVMASLDCFARQTGNGRIVWRGVFNLDANDSSVGKPVRFLQQAEYVQIGFRPMPAKSAVKDGKAVITLNSAVRLELPISEQQMPADFMIVKNIADVLAGLR